MALVQRLKPGKILSPGNMAFFCGTGLMPIAACTNLPLTRVVQMHGMGKRDMGLTVQILFWMHESLLMTAVCN